ncbi:hypothetical protein ATO6_00305 [Oceanicola sp. 22II-s10i]|uniref:protein-disulfide reductase DsbD domain-containing protein n=1 Tax=Oceanicola sp. 22II-s10i TaxID=1317116 RepID=UPI000B5224BA|nr:protein-disulfide reductase DsbD domain-containing protein [Oceanicola sp. 22II-s10i]OWU85436.1 hypothetical protein ATO6_00305 [Oceanicola sp. 22II-s10i]
MSYLSRLIPALALALPLAPAALANPYENNVSARILPGWRGADGRHVAGLELTLTKGWKTYWRSPGEAGVPPIFDWSGSDNLSAVQVVWPRPTVFDQNGLRSIGYHGRVVLPLVLTPARAGQPIRLDGDVSLGICEDVCVPLDLRISGTLPAQGGGRDPAIAAAMADRPYSAREAKVGKVECHLTPGQRGIGLSVDIAMPSAGGRETIVVESNDPGLWVADAETVRQGNRVVARTEIMHSAGGSFALDRSGLTITVLGRDHAVEISGCGG